MMFEVTAILARLPSKLVELTATDDVRGVTTLLTGIRGRAFRCPYDFPAGSQFILEFSPWKKLKVGDSVDVSTVLKHSSVQKLIFQNCTSSL